MILKIVGTVLVALCTRAHTMEMLRATLAKEGTVSTSTRIGYMIAEGSFVGVIIWAIWA